MEKLVRLTKKSAGPSTGPSIAIKCYILNNYIGKLVRLRKNSQQVRPRLYFKHNFTTNIAQFKKNIAQFKQIHSIWKN